MFGFLRKRSEQPQELETLEVSLEELASWFEKAMERDISQKRREAEASHSRIIDSFSWVRASLEALDKSRLMGTERLHISANMIKESFVKKSYAPLNSLESFQRSSFRPDYDYFMSFQEKGMDTVKELKNATPKQTILLTRFFKRESEELVGRIKSAEQLLQDFREFLKSGSGALGTLRRIRSMAREYADLRREADMLDARSSGLEKELESRRERKSELEKRFLELLKSRDWNRVNELKKEAADVRSRLRDAEIRLNTELSSVSRPIKKLEHSVVKNGKITPIQKNALQDFIRNPLRAIMSEKGEKSLQACLSSVKKQIDRGKLELKDKEMLKVDDLIERLKGDIPEMKERYLKLKQEGEEIEKRIEELSGLASSKDGMEGEIKRISDDSGKLEYELKGLKSRSASLAEQMKEKVRDMGLMILEDTQKKVKIVA